MRTWVLAPLGVSLLVLVTHQACVFATHHRLDTRTGLLVLTGLMAHT